MHLPEASDQVDNAATGDDDSKSKGPRALRRRHGKKMDRKEEIHEIGENCLKWSIKRGLMVHE
jgi:hypothetical protein